MKIGELSRRTGVSVRMLRYYEDEALLKPARRESGYRDYGREDMKVVEAIRILNSSGLKLAFIRRFLPCLRSEGPMLHPCPDLMAAMEQEMQSLDDQIKQYRKSRTMLGSYYSEMCEQTRQRQ
ncbi:MAG: MerR family transcriptional regulator [Pseudophaeobacter sp.]|uniref:MerR family transcriptional regulator n=1 Tax=Pseudophaeobacter sp. TaxID=1971739 RepID=UPI00329A4C8A